MARGQVLDAWVVTAYRQCTICGRRTRSRQRVVTILGVRTVAICDGCTADGL